MDPLTLLRANFLFFLLYVIAIAVTGRSHGRIRGGLWFAWANGLRACVVLLHLVFRGHVRQWADIVTNSIVLIGLLCLHRAFAAVVREPFHIWRTQAGVVAAGIAGMVAVGVMHGPYRLLLPIVSFTAAAILALTATMLLGSGETNSSTGNRRSASSFSAALFLTYCLLSLLRAAETLRFVDPQSPQQLQFNSLWLLTSLVINGGIAFGFVLIASEQLSHQLKLKAQTDALTRLRNRHGLPSVTASLDADRRIVTVSAVSLDLDGMKDANDRYGHDFGDRVLREVAALLLNVVPRPDCAIRLGGDEFLILLPNYGLDEAATIAEKLRRTIRNLHIPPHEDSALIRASLGVIALHPGPTRWQNLLERADHAMYRAKQDGRDRVAIEFAAGTWKRTRSFDTDPQPK